VSSSYGHYNEPEGFKYHVEFHHWPNTVIFQRGTLCSLELGSFVVCET
jgi:hypothetical protein